MNELENTTISFLHTCKVLSSANLIVVVGGVEAERKRTDDRLLEGTALVCASMAEVYGAYDDTRIKFVVVVGEMEVEEKTTDDSYT